MLYNIQ